MWFIGVEVEQETSAPPPKKNPGSTLYFGTITEPGSPVLGAVIYHKNNIILCDTSYQQRCQMA